MRKIAALLLLLLNLGCGTLPAPHTSLTAAAPPPDSPAIPPGPTTSSFPRCAPDEFDMLDWMTLDEDLRGGTYLHGFRSDSTNANDLYTVVQEDRFYWLKSSQGWPWDIELVDDAGIYDWITEYSWTDPYSFKKSLQDKNKKWANRCMKLGDRVQSTDTSYAINTADCGRNGNQTIHDLKNMVTTVDSLQHVTLGGDLPANIEVLVFNYDYVCDGNFEHCADRETYLFSQRYGLVHWQHQHLSSDGQAYLPADNVTIFNQIKHGAPPVPDFPCQ